MLAQLLALLVPPRCLGCGAPASRAEEPLCRTCRRAVPWLAARRCPRCALPSPCAPCPARRAAFEASWTPVAYAGPSRALVRALKFDGALPAATVMASQLAATLPPGLLTGAVLVPVPADPGRRRSRGLDHADRLARALAARTGVPLARCLRRTGPQAPQATARAGDRRAPGRLPVTARGPAPAVAALVDDVHTPGATLDACALALRAAGARRVVALAYARTLPDRVLEPVDSAPRRRHPSGTPVSEALLALPRGAIQEEGLDADRGQGPQHPRLR